MAISIIDKIKQKNGATFKLLDYIDVHGRITGWQNPVEGVFDNIAAITGLSEGDYFIVKDTAATWAQFQNLDIYGNAASKTNNAIYYIGEAIDGEALPVYLVTIPSRAMIVYNVGVALIIYNDGAQRWDNLISGSAITGQVLRAEESLTVQVGVNYDAGTSHLTISTIMQANDNVNVYVNGIKYTYGASNAFTYVAGESYLIWNHANAGFYLDTGDFIEIEIFNQE